MRNYPSPLPTYLSIFINLSFFITFSPTFFSHSYFNIHVLYCSVLHHTVRAGGGEEEVIRLRAKEESAEHERSHHTPALRLGEISVTCCSILFHLFVPLSVHSQPLYHFYSFSFSSSTHRLYDRCAILIVIICTSLPTHTHTHDSPLTSPFSP
jgi:hypothetical protein